MRCVTLLILVLLPAISTAAESNATPAPREVAITIENDLVQIVLGADGGNLEFIDKATGTAYGDHQAVSTFAQVSQSGKDFPATSASYANGLLNLSFAGAKTRASVRVDVQSRYLTFEVVEVSGQIDSFTFFDAQLTLAGNLEEPFAACLLALNLQTNVTEIPGPNRRLRVTCYERFGFNGAKVALIACSQAQLREVMQEVVSATEELPKSNIGGPWALDGPINRGSYLFDFGDCTEETVDDWIALATELGVTQIDFHTGRSLRFGDCRPNPELFPNGRASVKAVLDKLEQAGIAAGLHTYAFFIAKDTPYVTPKPDSRLGKDATFTLVHDLTSEADTVPVAESTEAMSTITGFFVRNSVTLQIDDELITYRSISKESPYAFTGCTRGAYGTQVAEHAAGAKVQHLKECFGLFTPDPETTLLAEVASNTAETFNECGFDMIYLDALDGEDILGGRENSWHYGSKFVFEIAKRLRQPALFEMSTFHHHLWYVRARMGAWDHPNRAHKKFIDIHVAANQAGAKMLLPMNLGWWAAKTWGGARREPTFPDDIEYLMGKCLGNGFGFSLMGVNPSNIGTFSAFQRLAPIFRQYEELRHADYFSENLKAKLRVPGDEYTLEATDDGKWRFRPVQYAKHKVCGMDGWSNIWTTTNDFGPQPVRLRIEALMAAQPYDSDGAVLIEDFSNPDILNVRSAQSGLTAFLEYSTTEVRIGNASGHLTVRNGGHARKGAWSKLGKPFSPLLDLSKTQGLGVWVHGDGKGELLNLQLKSPAHLAHGMGDYYIDVDFTGWRYFELIEHEGGRIDDLGWPYGGNYAIYREDVNFGHIDSFALWSNLVSKGGEISCYLSPIKALPVVANTLRNPEVLIGETRIQFPVAMESGTYLEFNSLQDCKLYGPKGDLLAEVKPQGAVPRLQAGENTVEFRAECTQGLNPRARVVVITGGELLHK
jgi:hypothetical protein